MQAVAQGILITDASWPDQPIIYASPGFERLTGYSRAEVLESILRPSAKIAQGFETYTFVLQSGKLVTGFIVRESGTEVEVRDATGATAVIKKDDKPNAHGVEEVSVLVEGYGLRLCMNTEGVDGTRTTTNSVMETKEVLGIEAARRVTGQPIPVELKPRRPGDPARLVASSERAKVELGWKPKHPQLDDILASAWEWHQRRYRR